MKHSNLWNGTSLIALAIIAGAPRKMAPLNAVEEPSINSRHAQPQFDRGLRTAAAVASEKNEPGFCCVHIDPNTSEMLPAPSARGLAHAAESRGRRPKCLRRNFLQFRAQYLVAA